MVKKYVVHGSVDRVKKEDVVKRETEGVGENKITRTVEVTQYAAVIVGSDGQRIRLTQDDPFPFAVEEVVSVTVDYGLQTKLDDEQPSPKPKRK